MCGDIPRDELAPSAESVTEATKGIRERRASGTSRSVVHLRRTKILRKLLSQHVPRGVIVGNVLDQAFVFKDAELVIEIGVIICSRPSGETTTFCSSSVLGEGLLGGSERSGRSPRKQNRPVC
jgi:hypothetical protein